MAALTSGHERLENLPTLTALEAKSDLLVAATRATDDGLRPLAAFSVADDSVDDPLPLCRTTRSRTTGGFPINSWHRVTGGFPDVNGCGSRGDPEGGRSMRSISSSCFRVTSFVPRRPHANSDSCSYRDHSLFASDFGGSSALPPSGRLETQAQLGTWRSLFIRREMLREVYKQRPSARVLSALAKLYAALIVACTEHQKSSRPSGSATEGLMSCAVASRMGQLPHEQSEPPTKTTCARAPSLLSSRDSYRPRQPAGQLPATTYSSCADASLKTSVYVTVANAKERDQRELRPFVSARALSPAELEDFLTEVSSVMCTTDAVMVLSLIYVDRLLVMKPYLTITYSNLPRLLPATLLIAIKFLDDIYRSNASYSSAVRLPDLHQLEANFLKLIDYRAFVSDETFQRYCETLRHFDTSAPSILQRNSRAVTWHVRTQTSVALPCLYMAGTQVSGNQLVAGMADTVAKNPQSAFVASACDSVCSPWKVPPKVKA